MLAVPQDFLMQPGHMASTGYMRLLLLKNNNSLSRNIKMKEVHGKSHKPVR